MKTQEVARQITPGKKIYTFSKDEVKEILLKAALKELNQSEPPLSEYEMRLRVTLNVHEASEYNEWEMALSVLESIQRQKRKN